MKLLVLDGKKLGVVIVAMGLMIVLFGIGMNLDSRIRSTAFIQNNMGALTEYEISGYRIKYKLPSKWTAKEQKFIGNEIIYHNDYKSEDSVIRGFVEVWRLNGSLKEFLDKSRTASQTQNEVLNYNISDVKVNNKDGYLVTYKMQSGNKIYDAFEYFIKDNQIFIRFSFYIDSSKFNANISDVFKAIVQTLNNE